MSIDLWVEYIDSMKTDLDIGKTEYCCIISLICPYHWHYQLGYSNCK